MEKLLILGFNMRKQFCNTRLMAAIVVALAIVTLVPFFPAMAQEEKPVVLEEIIVTGTLIRGTTAPVGTNLVGVDADQIKELGLTNVQDLLAQVPQVTNNFQSLPFPGREVGLPTNLPNMRNLGGTVGSSPTLILMDGFRLVGMGANLTAPDPAVIPAAILQRLEIVPDGGSSTYGSDAIGGVINFIPRKKVDGIEASARGGFAQGYATFTGSVLAGGDWGKGSAFVAYEFYNHNNITGSERNYVEQNNTSHGGQDLRTSTCAPGNITVGATTYALPGLVAGTLNKCDTSGVADIYPAETRHSIFASLTQEFTPTMTFDGHVLYTHRENPRRSGPLAPSIQTITNANPYFTPIGIETSHSVSFDFSPVSGPDNVTYYNMDVFQLTAGVTKQLGDFQLRVHGNYGSSLSIQRAREVNPTALAAAITGTTTATALNPYNVAATNASVLENVLDFENIWKGDQKMLEFRAVADGPVFTLPAGDLRLALGIETHHEDLAASSGDHKPGSNIGVISLGASRNIISAFGELLVPILPKTSGVGSLEASLSGRYDRYNDVGPTTNPKVGLTYKPVDWISVRANYGTSFNAPSIADTVAGVDTRNNCLPFSPLLRPGDGAYATRYTIVIAGSNPNLKPQQANTYSVGLDFKPPFLPNFRGSLTYYNIDFSNYIAFPPPGQVVLNPLYAAYVTFLPTYAQAAALLEGRRYQNVTGLAQLYAGGVGPYAILDCRRNNLGGVKLDGIDFNLAYDYPTDFGDVNASLAGTYTLSRKSTAIKGAAEVDDLEYSQMSRFGFVAGLGAQVGQLSGRLQLNYTDGFPVHSLVGQTEVDSFKTVDLFFSYGFKKDNGFFSDTSLTLNVENLFDQDPPYMSVSGGFGNGATTGRTVFVGLNKKFSFGQ